MGTKKKQKRRIFVGIRWAFLLCLLFSVWFIQASPVRGEWYAQKIYPVVSSFLSVFSGNLSFSLGDLFIYLSISVIFLYLVFSFLKPCRIVRGVLRVGEFLLWVYVWFYAAWGLNYFRQDFYARSGLDRLVYQEDDFRLFLDRYIADLNNAYDAVKISAEDLPSSSFLLEVEQAALRGYEEIAPSFGLLEPRSSMHAKPMLCSSLMSKMGILGYMGPFFAEFNLNKELPLVQYPSGYFHELAHRLGVANEAEANLYAYLVATDSENPQLCFSGYFSILGYALGNARMVLDEGDYKQLIDVINPGIITLYRDTGTYWNLRYSEWIGKIQNRIYNLFLKGNNIRSGTKNYAEVIGLLISYQKGNGHI